MENYQHTVFFEANDLSDVEIKQIHKYFSIRRRSGGEQCEISKVGDNTFKIIFMNKEGKRVFIIAGFFCTLLQSVLYFYLTQPCQNNCNNDIPFIIMTVP